MKNSVMATKGPFAAKEKKNSVETGISKTTEHL